MTIESRNEAMSVAAGLGPRIVVYELSAVHATSLGGDARPPAGAVRWLLRPGDATILHDPQTAGLIEPLRGEGHPVVCAVTSAVTRATISRVMRCAFWPRRVARRC